VSENETQKLNLHERIAAVMRAVRGVKKSERNTHANYNYAGHEALTDALRDHYVKHGIVRTASVVEWKRDGGHLSVVVKVSWINVDDPNDRHEVLMLGESPPVTKNGQGSPVQAGIALSYAVKNAEFKTFALTGDDTPDAASMDNQTPDLVLDFVERYQEASTVQDIDDINAAVKSEWSKVSKHRAELVAARGEAMKRVSE
jgi:hypothetical protein